MTRLRETIPDDQRPSSPGDAKSSESQDLKSTGLLCKQLVRAGELERAKIMCQEMISEGKHHLGIWLGILLAEQGDQQAAEAAFDSCLQRGVPVFMLSFFGARSVVFARTGAKAALQKCVELGNLYAAGRLAESLAHESGWDSVRAVHGINARFERVDSVHVPGELSVAVSRGEDAKARYLETFAMGDFRVVSLLNPLLEDEMDLEKARVALKNVKMHFPGHILDAVFCGAGDLDELDNCILFVEGCGGDTSDAEIYRDVLHANAGNRAEADRAFRRAIAYGKAGPQFTLVGLLAKAANRRGAKAAFEKAVDLGDAYGVLCLGKLLLETGDDAGAEVAFTVGMKLGSGAAAYRLGVLLGDLGEASRSIDAFQRARKLGYESTQSLQPPSIARNRHERLSSR